MAAFTFLGDQLLTKAGLRPTTEVLAGKDYVLLYFSASWCPPCQQFTPQLAGFYNLNKDAKKFEIVFVTNDRDQGSMMQYYDAKMPWAAIPYGTPAHQRVMSAGYCGRGIPDVCIFDSSARVVKRGAVQNIMSDPRGHQFPWPERPPKGPTFECPVELTLEELYAGVTKKRKITRKRVQGNAVVDEPTILEITTKPGWKAGTKVTFPGESDETQQQSAGDVVFVVQQKPHATFERRDADLVHRPSLPAGAAHTLQLTLLDGSTVSVEVPADGTAKVAGKGMPIRKGGQQVGLGDVFIEPVWQ